MCLEFSQALIKPKLFTKEENKTYCFKMKARGTKTAGKDATEGCSLLGLKNCVLGESCRAGLTLWRHIMTNIVD